MVKLFGAIVGDGRVFGVQIHLRETVYDLKKKILKEFPDLTSFGAAALTLYLARRDGKWLKEGDKDMEEIQNGEIPSAIEALMQASMRPVCQLINDAYFGDNFEPQAEEYHVMVELRNPKKRCWEEQHAALSAKRQVTDSSDYWRCDILRSSFPLDNARVCGVTIAAQNPLGNVGVQRR